MTSEKWAGFTDEDIEQIKSTSKLSKSCSDKICELDGLVSASKNRGPMKIKNAVLKTVKSEQLCDLYEDNSLYIETKSKESLSPCDENAPAFKNSVEDIRSVNNDENCSCNNNLYEENRIDMHVIDNTEEMEFCHGEHEKCDEGVQSNANLPALEMFEMRQKRIEAENARRRALINKAINDKKKRTQAEAVKLAKITQELNLIDSNLSADVSILRNYIERASLEFSDAEKRYLKAEKEFVEAKLLLFEKMQKKEMLTEHLCAIIEQNENRKADKLVELMKQLEMEVIMEDFEVNGMQPILQNLCILNDEPYHSCQTLKPSLSKENTQEQITSEATQNPDNLQKETTDTEEFQEGVDKDILNTSKTESNLSADGTEDLK